MAEIELPKTTYRRQVHSTSSAITEAPYTIACPPTIVPGSTITFCGESPGRQEVLERKGFVGGSGNVLWSMARQAGIDQLKVNRTNVAKRRPPSDDFGVFYHDPQRRTQPTDELRFWQSLLVKELQLHTPRVFVAVGDESLRAVAPSVRGISKWRGSILESEVIPGMKVVPIVHPAWIMRMNWEYYYVGIKDLKKAYALANGVDLREPEPLFITKPTFAQAMEWLNEVRTSNTAEWYIDIETRGDTISCFAISISTLADSAICIPIHTTTGPYWSEAEEAAIWRALGDAFSSNPNCVNQNLVYDIEYFLSDYRIEPSGFKFDSMIAHKLCYPEFPKGLDFLTSIYTNVPYYKDEGKTWKVKTPDQQLWIYNCKDVWVTPKVTKAIRAELSLHGLTETYNRRAGKFLPIALEMQRNRLRVDHNWWKKLGGILEEERTKVHSELSKLTGIKEEELNVKSSPQVQKILYEILRLPVRRKRGTDKVSTEENIIKELRSTVSGGSDAYRTLDGILRERHLRTRQSNYINVTLDEDHHWPYTILINNDKSGRWESTSSPKWRGSKITHIPKVIRLMFEPPPGRIFVQRDLSQGEVRYVAAEARCLFLNNILASGASIHKRVGARLFGAEPAKDSLEYDTAKSIVHAYDYMMGYKRLAVEANLSYQFAERTYNDYSREVPEISRWHQRIKDEATRLGYLLTPTGRKRQCFSACAMVANTGALADEIWRDLVSWKPQATIPDILNEGMYRTWDELGVWVLFHQQGHDSHLDSIPPDKLTEYAERTELFHTVPIVIDREFELTIPSELSWGYSWGALKPFTKGDRGTHEEWLAWATEAKCFEVEGKGGIKERLYAMF